MKAETKKILIIIGIAVGVIVAGLLIYAAIVSPSKQPYRDAQSKWKSVYNANVVFTNAGSSLGTTSATNEQFAKNVKNAEAALEALKTETAALGKQAVMTEGEGKELYDAFNKQLQAYAAYNVNILDSIEKVRPVIFACSQTASTINEDDASAEALRVCATNLGTVEDVPDADYKALVVSFKKSYEDLAANLKNEEVRTQILDDLSSANTTLTQNLQAARNKVDITATAKAIDDYLNKKSSIF